MAGVAQAPRSQPGGPSAWAQKYPPLVAMAVALLIALIVLPSSLNLPQTNPTQTLEYAPVPPDEETDDAPPDGNFAALGLGSSSGIEGGGAGGGPGPGGGPPPAVIDGGQGVDADFQCVGSPPRQTRDPLSPPCVPYFEGDNGGATYRGVTANEVRVLFYMDGPLRYVEASNSGNTDSPGNTLIDLRQSQEDCEREHDTSKCTHLVTESLRIWQTYFNRRFQTYGRDVHFWLFFSSAGNAEQRRADAAKLLRDVDPFAVVSVAEGAEDDFLHAMARKGVLNFGSFGVRPAPFFNEFPRTIWSYLPSVEQQAEQYGTYVCTKVVNQTAVMADATLNGRPRKLGMLHTVDQNWPGLIRMAELVKQKVEGCGGTIADTATFNGCCLARRGGSVDPGAQQKMASFKNQGITTILWTGGINGEFAKAAAAGGYFPEWIVLGDTLLDAHHPVRLSDSSPSFDGHAVVVTPQTFQPALEQQLCFQAFREVNRTFQDTDLQYTCTFYRDLFQLFVGIQVAGPYLGPTQIDKGFHAIPQKYNGDPQVPACFYLPGDYTCVKDSTVMYWDAEQNPPGDERPGCWRAIEGGRRYGPGQWPEGNINAQINGSEPCSGYDHRARFSTT